MVIIWYLLRSNGLIFVITENLLYSQNETKDSFTLLYEKTKISLQLHHFMSFNLVKREEKTNEKAFEKGRI
ncbi:hypothetical protein CWO92_07235 [Heyndrickxia camelliae]|uniref:Uncharacterized protein n=1 Tax=Heyndrickxia camelliae TaxID=1707093 RepID=A0A2N3LLH1_9BACI|nr:hypothetical protein CWO92_07235 [Heyndrickxia camelliae]